MKPVGSGVKLPKAPRGLGSTCRHCLERVSFQLTIDDERECLNIDGSPHKCRGYLDEVHARGIGPVYARRSPKTQTAPPVEQEPMPPFQSHSPTSEAASIAVEDKAGDYRRRVYEFYLKRGAEGATDDEVQVALDMDPSTQRPRRIELVENGKLMGSEKRRRTRAGRFAVVWVAR